MSISFGLPSIPELSLAPEGQNREHLGLVQSPAWWGDGGCGGAIWPQAQRSPLTRGPAIPCVRPALPAAGLVRSRPLLGGEVVRLATPVPRPSPRPEAGARRRADRGKRTPDPRRKRRLCHRLRGRRCVPTPLAIEPSNRSGRSGRSCRKRGVPRPARNDLAGRPSGPDSRSRHRGWYDIRVRGNTLMTPHRRCIGLIRVGWPLRIPRAGVR
jgi:hypothetical protein